MVNSSLDVTVSDYYLEMEKRSAYMQTQVGHNLVIDVVFFAIPEPQNKFTTWTLENENENVVINLAEGSPHNVKKFFTAAKLQSLPGHKYLARLEIFDIKEREDDLDIHFQITNFLKYPDEVFHLVIRVSDGIDVGPIKAILIIFLGLLFSVGAFINFIYCIKSFKSKGKTYTF